MIPRPTSGEMLAITELLVVSPAWGRVRRGDLRRGRRIEAGSIVGHLAEDIDLIPVVAHTGGIFVTWLVREGERVPPGRPLARLVREN